MAAVSGRSAQPMAVRDTSARYANHPDHDRSAAPRMPAGGILTATDGVAIESRASRGAASIARTR